MAACCRLLSVGIKSQFTNKIKVTAILSRKYSSNSNKNIENGSSWITLTDNGSTVVAWHPEQEFPYEHSKPIPIFDPELNEADSVLKVQHKLLHKYRFRPEGPTMAELQKLTFTTKHRWYPNNRGHKQRPQHKRERDFV